MAVVMLSPRDLARRWRVNLGTLANWRCKRVGPPYVAIGKKIFYRPHEIEAFEEKHVQLKDGKAK